MRKGPMVPDNTTRSTGETAPHIPKAPMNNDRNMPERPRWECADHKFNRGVLCRTCGAMDERARIVHRLGQYRATCSVETDRMVCDDILAEIRANDA